MSYSILVVDDDFHTRQMLRLFLELQNFTVFEAEDGLDALKSVQANRPDLVILDVMMPIMDGITACKKLRSERATADLPVIMFSGKSQPTAVEEGLRAGAARYILKPLSPVELLQAVQEVLHASQRLVPA